MRARAFPRAGAERPHTVWLLAVIAVALLLVACSSGPVPIAYDQDSCDYCRMQISDPRYGGELITRTGKAHKFDSIECLASFYAGLEDSATIRSLWVSDYRQPGTLIAAREALYIHHAGPGSPMGRGLLAMQAGSGAPAAGVPAGDTLNWRQVVRLVGGDGVAPGASTVSSRGAPQRAIDARPH
jgi:copper chaperone NosL